MWLLCFCTILQTPCVDCQASLIMALPSPSLFPKPPTKPHSFMLTYGFPETLESIGRASLNVSLSAPLPLPFLNFIYYLFPHLWGGTLILLPSCCHFAPIIFCFTVSLSLGPILFAYEEAWMFHCLQSTTKKCFDLIPSRSSVFQIHWKSKILMKSLTPPSPHPSQGHIMPPFCLHWPHHWMHSYI